MSVDGEFKRLTAKDRLCAAVLKAVRENDTAALRRLGLGGFAQYAGRLSELMTASVRSGLDWAPDFAALMRQVNSPVRYAHHLVNECGTAVQTALDERNGLRLRVVQPEYNDGRTKAIVGEAAESDSEHAADNLATQLGTEVKDAGNEFMKQNAEQRSRAGFTVTVERTGGANCCPWCADRIGRWELKNAPSDVFGNHDKCTCMVTYTNSRGVRTQRLGRSRFVEVNYTPTRLTDGEKRGAGEPKRLTGGGNGGIIESSNSRNGSSNQLLLEAENPYKNPKTPLTVDSEAQSKHIKGGKRYNDYMRTHQYEPSMLTISEEKIQELVNKYHGTGILKLNSLGEVIESEIIIDNNEIIGYASNNRNGKTQPTTAFKIHYSQDGTHIVPTYESQKKYWSEKRNENGYDWLLRQKG